VLGEAIATRSFDEVANYVNPAAEFGVVKYAQ
jgi:hypothetical protein